jgi:hypothetical protein
MTSGWSRGQRPAARRHLSHKQAAFQHAYQLQHHVSAVAAAGQTVACGGHAGAGFLFINDLTTAATGATLIALTVLYIGTQLASTLMTRSAGMDQTQRRLMMLLPLVFVIFIVQFPAGLIVYWITTNAWTVAQQYVIRRWIGPITPATTGLTAPSTADDGRRKHAARQPAAVASGGRRQTTWVRARRRGARAGG